MLCVVLLLFPIIEALGTTKNYTKKTNTSTKSTNTKNNAMKIFGGRPVSISEFGYQLQYVIKKQTICGASLISNVWAITAAHCTAAFPNGITLLGGSNVRGSGIFIPVLRVVQHPAYNPMTFDNDLSLLFFAPVWFSSTLYPIKLAAKTQDFTQDTVCKVSGFGLTEEGVQPTTLLGTEVVVSDQTSCVENYTLVSFAVNPTIMLCAGTADGLQDSCSGDSVSFLQ